MRNSGRCFRNSCWKTPETQGMIPRAVAQLFATTDELRSKGWEYTMEGQFLEIVRVLRLLNAITHNCARDIVQRDFERPTWKGRI